MYRDNKPVLSEEHISLLIVHHALGDAITSLPAIRYAAAVSPETRYTVWTAPQQIALFKHLVPTVDYMDIREFETIVKAKNRRELAGPGRANAIVPTPLVTRNKIDLVEYAYLVLLDMQVDVNDVANRRYPYEAELGPRRADLPGKYIVLPTGATCMPSAFKAHVIGPIIEWAHANGYTPVLTGKRLTVVRIKNTDKTTPTFDYVDDLPLSTRNLCLDLRDKLNLMELRDLCGHASAVCGIDGGTLHLAGTTEVPIVYACTRVHPKDRPIYRVSKNWRVAHIVPRDLECAHCQTNWLLKFKHDFSRCAYGDALCTDRLHPDDFIDGLKSLGL